MTAPKNRYFDSTYVWRCLSTRSWHAPFPNRFFCARVFTSDSAYATLSLSLVPTLFLSFLFFFFYFRIVHVVSGEGANVCLYLDVKETFNTIEKSSLNFHGDVSKIQSVSTFAYAELLLHSDGICCCEVNEIGA